MVGLKRVVITGIGGVSALGDDWATISDNFLNNRSGIRYMHEWDRFTDLNTRLGGPLNDFTVPAHWTRKQLRSMGPVSQYVVYAAERALDDAGLLGEPSIQDGRMGVACGSSTGSPQEAKKLCQYALELSITWSKCQHLCANDAAYYSRQYQYFLWSKGACYSYLKRLYQR